MRKKKTERIKEVLERISYLELSEADVQRLIVEPILEMVFGEDIILNPLATTRAKSGNETFDINILPYHPNDTVIEIKSNKSNEIKLHLSGNRVGALRFSSEKGKWVNKPGDGIGQVRSYFSNLVEEGRKPVPILTNGLVWCVFNKENLLRDKEKPIAPDQIELIEIASCPDILVQELKKIIFGIKRKN